MVITSLSPLRWAIALALLSSLGACGSFSSNKARPLNKSNAPLRTVHHVDLPRYMGDWRVIAHIPSLAEKGCVDSIESYALRPDGKIENWFTYRKKSFNASQRTFKAIAQVVNTETNAEWKIKFFGLVGAKYMIIGLDPDYQWAVVGQPSRDYGWILARGRTLPPSTYEDLLDRMAVQGYDPARFVKVPQVPDGAEGVR